MDRYDAAGALRQFDRFAAVYEEHSSVQAQVAKALIAGVRDQPRCIVDIGCGSGLVWRNISWPVTRFIAVDAAPNMLAQHPVAIPIEKRLGDFNRFGADMPDAFEPPLDLVISASALHWAIDLAGVLAWLKNLPARQLALALFTGETFREFHRFTAVTSPIPSRETIVDALQRAFGQTPELRTYRRHFSDTLTMLRYIKRCGISGGRARAGTSRLRQVIRDCPIRTLDFEVALLWWRQATPNDQ